MSAFRTIAFAAAVILSALPAWAQSEQDQKPQPPAAGPAMPGPMGPRGAMMGNGMMENGSRGTMSQGMMGGQGTTMGGPMMGGQGMGGPMMGMMAGGPGRHIEGRLAFIKAELKITDAQSAPWNAFADAVRENANAMADTHAAMMSGASAAQTLPERLAFAQQAMAAHLDGLTKTSAALDKLYEALGPDQKKVADEIVIGPMGMPMGMM